MENLTENLTEEKKCEIEQIIRDRFASGKVEDVHIEWGADEVDGDLALQITAYMSDDLTEEDVKGRYFGLTRLVRDAMGEGMRHIFPYIRLTNAAEEAEVRAETGVGHNPS